MISAYLPSQPVTVDINTFQIRLDLSTNRTQDSVPSYGANKSNEMAKKDLDYKKTFK